MDAILWVLAVIASAGFVGGWSAYLLQRHGGEAHDATLPDASPKPLALSYLIPGIAAAACVPLFLSLVRSSLLRDIFADPPASRVEEYLIFAGLCLVAAFSARRFLTSISERLLRQLSETREIARNAAARSETALELADDQNAPTPTGQDGVRGVRGITAAIAPGGPQASDSDEDRALWALTQRTFRTASGIASDTGISRNRISEILDTLHGDGLAALERSPATGGARWKITEQGMARLDGSARGQRNPD